jgi:hypothetical protein
LRPSNKPKHAISIQKVEEEYAKSLDKYEKKGLIIDDYSIDNVVTMTREMIEPYNEITEKGNAVVNNMSKIIEGEQGIRATEKIHVGVATSSYKTDVFL